MPENSEISSDLEQALHGYYEAPATRPVYIAQLERQLLERQAALLASETGRSVSLRRFWRPLSAVLGRHRWQAAALSLAFILVVALIAAGPQRVLAQVQRLLGYVPGIGFVDLAETRVLAGPVEVTRGSVHLRVEQVVAGPERTQVVISSPGLSEEDLPWPNPGLEQIDFHAALRLPDGTRLEPTTWTLNIGAGKLEFPPLPTGVYQVTLELRRLPLVPPGALPEDWEALLNLRLATGELAAEIFPLPYSPVNASDTHHGITLRVLDVAQGPDETAIRWQVEWPDPAWEFRFGLGSERMPELRDDLGHVYWESMGTKGASVSVAAVQVEPNSAPTPTPAMPSRADILSYAPLSLTASQATLWVDGLEFEVPAAGGFTVDLGDRPQIGDHWALDIRLDVAGLPVHLTAARLREETVEYGDGRSERRSLLEFDMAPLPEKDGFRLRGFDLNAVGIETYGSGGSYEPGGRYKVHLDLGETGPLPTGSIHIRIERANLVALGPWELSWKIPGSERAAPVTLNLEDARQVRNGIEVSLEQVFLSDRLTALRLAADDLPAGAAFVQPLYYNLGTADPQNPKSKLYLEDSWGRRYQPGRNQAFLRTAGDQADYDPKWLFFLPLEPFAQRAELHVPAVELFLPGQANFQVEVPGDVQFKPEPYTVHVIGGGGPEREVTEIHWVSDPWTVDIPLEIAGYRLHLTQARLEREEDSQEPYRLALTGDPLIRRQGEQFLNELHFAAVTRPDGQTIQVDHSLQERGLIGLPVGGIGREDPGSEQQAGIMLDVTDARGMDLLPGQYQVFLDGVTVWVPGPWDLGWSLSANQP